MNDTITLPQRDRDHERALGIVFNISPAQASVLSCLSRGVVASTNQLLEYSGSKSQMKVIINHVRKALAPHDLVIHSKQHVGYWIDADNRSTIETMVMNFLGGNHNG